MYKPRWILSGYGISSRRELILPGVFALICLGLWFVDPAPRHPGVGSKEKARVISVDNSDVRDYGLVKQGSQRLEVVVLSGEFRGKRFPAANELRAQLELDKSFVPGDTVLVGIMHGAQPGVTVINAQDYYRLGNTAWLFGIFALLLLGFGGFVGLNALLSFVFSCLVIWKVVVPLALRGVEPISLIFAVVMALSAGIILLVAGWNRKGLAALAGTFFGVGTSAVMALVFTRIFRINGAVMPYSQALLFSGYEFLSLPSIYVGAVFLSASGAVMDLAMDVASGIAEIHRRRPGLTGRQLLISGIQIGRSVVGTMTTTLLLAYSGGYLTLLMVFAAQGVEPVDFLNNPYVVSETVKTLIGSFGLVLVAPFTALAGAIIFRRKAKKRDNVEPGA